jgi:hypothetical protein
VQDWKSLTFNRELSPIFGDGQAGQAAAMVHRESLRTLTNSFTFIRACSRSVAA